MSTEKMEPVAYVTEIQEGKVLLLPRASLDAAVLTPLYTASQLKAAVAAERERCAKVCDTLAAGTLAGQFGSIDDLSNVMLRQVAVLGHQQCAAAIRQLGDEQ